MQKIEKYNIALVPNTINEQVVQLAQQFQSISDEYLLGHQALPHVTLCHFHADPKKLTQIWQRTKSLLQVEDMVLTFADYSCVTFDNIIYWISLMPDHRQELILMHRVVASIVTNSSLKPYDPHMTLCNFKNPLHKENISAILSRSFVTLADSFHLVLGKSGVAGQLTAIIDK